jgi:HEAT repeat protein
MLRWTGAHGISTLLSLLEGEKAAGRRMALIRLISRSGYMGVDVTRERLHDERWYVVRNACTILAELNDPELLEHLLPVLAHPDVRVQKAAINAIVNSRSPERGQALAAGLQYLRGEALLQALDEIAFLKDPATAPQLEKFIRSNSAQTRLVEKGFQVLLVFPVEQIAENVVRIITELSGNPAFEIAVATIKRSRPEIQESLMKFAGDSKQPALRSLSASAGKSK